MNTKVSDSPDMNNYRVEKLMMSLGITPGIFFIS
jgi:hypothetical protein